MGDAGSAGRGGGLWLCLRLLPKGGAGRRHRAAVGAGGRGGRGEGQLSLRRAGRSAAQARLRVRVLRRAVGRRAGSSGGGVTPRLPCAGNHRRRLPPAWRSATRWADRVLSGGLLLGNPPRRSRGALRCRRRWRLRGGVPLLPVPLYEAAGNALLLRRTASLSEEKGAPHAGKQHWGLYLSAYAVLRFCWNFCAGTKRAAAGGAERGAVERARGAAGRAVAARAHRGDRDPAGRRVDLCGSAAALRAGGAGAGARLYRDEKGKLRAEARVLGKPLTGQQLAAHRQRRKELPGGRGQPGAKAAAPGGCGAEPSRAHRSSGRCGGDGEAARLVRGAAGAAAGVGGAARGAGGARAFGCKARRIFHAAFGKRADNASFGSKWEIYCRRGFALRRRLCAGESAGGRKAHIRRLKAWRIRLRTY